MLLKFSDEALDTVHKVFFDGKGTLVHKNRLDFIEIFYLLFILKLVEEGKPADIFGASLCKDAIDITGAACQRRTVRFLENDEQCFCLVQRRERIPAVDALFSSSFSARARY